MPTLASSWSTRTRALRSAVLAATLLSGSLATAASSPASAEPPESWTWDEPSTEWFGWTEPDGERRIERPIVGRSGGENGYVEAGEFGPDDDYTYTCEDNAATITGYTGNGGHLAIPAELGGCLVTRIGAFAFDGLAGGDRALGHVSVPDSVVVIENRAFRRSGLTGLALGTSFQSSALELIEVGAFAGNPVEEVAIPDAVTRIGDYAFSGAGLTSVTFGSTPRASALEHIGTEAFDHNSLTELVLPDPLATMGNGVFQRNNLERLIVGDRLEEVPFDAFKDNSISELSLGESVRVIRGNAFNGNDLTELTLPDAVSVIAGHAFRDNDLRTVSIGATEAAQTLELIDAHAFTGNALHEITFHAAVDDIHTLAFAGQAREDAEFVGWYDDRGFNRGLGGFPTAIGAENLPRTVHGRWSDTELPDFAGICEDGGATLTDYRGDGGDIVIPERLDDCPVTTIAARVFQNLGDTTRALGHVSLPDSVALIEDRAFAGSGMTGLSLGTSPESSSIESIGPSAFAGNRLESLLLPDSVRIIGDHAFGGNILTDVAFGSLREQSALESIGQYAFSGTSSGDGNRIGELILPHSLTSLAPYAFAWNAIASLELGDGLHHIPDSAFRFNALTDLKLPVAVTSVGFAAFSDNQLTDVDLGALEIVGQAAFSRNSLAGLTVPDSVRTIEQGAFGHNQLTEVTFGSSPENSALEAIGWAAFEGDLFDPHLGNQIAHLTIPAGVGTIDDRAFARNALRSVTFTGPVAGTAGNAFSPQHRTRLSTSWGLVLHEWYGWHDAPIGGVEIAPFPASIESPVNYYSLWDDSPTQWESSLDLAVAEGAPESLALGQAYPIEVRATATPDGADLAEMPVELWGAPGGGDPRLLDEGVLNAAHAAGFTFTPDGAGSWELWAVFPGDEELAVIGSASGRVIAEVDAAATRIAVGAVEGTVVAGEAVQLDVAVEAVLGGITVEGTVEVHLVDDEEPTTDGDPVAASALRDGAARLTVENLPVGDHLLMVVYAGTDDFGPSAAETVEVNVIPGEPASLTVWGPRSVSETETVTYAVEAFDARGNSAGDVTDQVTIDSDVAGDLTTGAEVSFAFTPSALTDRVLTFTYADSDGDGDVITATEEVTVASAVEGLTFDGPPELIDGQRGALSVTAVGAQGEPLAEVTRYAMLSSSVQQDVVEHNEITVTGLGPREITATYRGIEQRLTIQVAAESAVSVELGNPSVPADSSQSDREDDPTDPTEDSDGAESEGAPRAGEGLAVSGASATSVFAALAAMILLAGLLTMAAAHRSRR